MPTAATIMILDDDHAGVFSFEHDHFNVIESCGYVTIRVQRTSGCRGQISLPYRTCDGTATGGKHYETKEGELVFEDNQTEAFIEIGVVDTEQYEVHLPQRPWKIIQLAAIYEFQRSEYFYVEMLPPIWSKKMSGEYWQLLLPAKR